MQRSFTLAKIRLFGVKAECKEPLWQGGGEVIIQMQANDWYVQYGRRATERGGDGADGWCGGKEWNRRSKSPKKLLKKSLQKAPKKFAKKRPWMRTSKRWWMSIKKPLRYTKKLLWWLRLNDFTWSKQVEWK